MSGRPKLAPGTWGSINVLQLENGLYRASARFAESPLKTRRVSATGKTRAAAERELKLRLSTEAEKGSTTGQLNRYSTVAQAVNYWLEDLSFSTRKKSTINSYRQTAETLIIPSIGRVQLHELNPVICDRWLKEHLSISRSRAKRARNVLSQSITNAVTLGALLSNPLRSLGALPAAPVPPPRSLSPAEISAVRAAVQEPARHSGKGGRNPDDRLSCLVEILIGTGCRIGEALALRRCDIDLESDEPTISIEGTLTVDDKGMQIRSNTPKTPSSRRTIPISNAVVEAISFRLEATKNLPEETLIFQTDQGTPWQSANVRRRLRKALEVAGLTELNVHPHLFRKTVATEVDRQFGVRAAASILGHASTSVTETHYLARSSRVDSKIAHAMELFAPVDEIKKAELTEVLKNETEGGE